MDQRFHHRCNKSKQQRGNNKREREREQVIVVVFVVEIKHRRYVPFVTPLERDYFLQIIMKTTINAVVAE